MSETMNPKVREHYDLIDNALDTAEKELTEIEFRSLLDDVSVSIDWRLEGLNRSGVPKV